MRLPIDGALDLALEVGWEPGRNEGHLDILVRVWLKLSAHWFQLQVVTAHQTALLEVELQLVVLVHVVQDHESVADLTALQLAEVNGLEAEGSQHRPNVG